MVRYPQVHKVVDHMISDANIYRATFFESPRAVVKATRRGRPDRRERQESYVLTIGRPNYAEAKFIQLAKKAGEPFPIKKVQLKYYPKRAA